MVCRGSPARKARGHSFLRKPEDGSAMRPAAAQHLPSCSRLWEGKSSRHLQLRPKRADSPVSVCPGPPGPVTLRPGMRLFWRREIACFWGCVGQGWNGLARPRCPRQGASSTPDRVGRASVPVLSRHSVCGTWSWASAGTKTCTGPGGRRWGVEGFLINTNHDRNGEKGGRRPPLKLAVSLGRA